MMKKQRKTSISRVLCSALCMGTVLVSMSSATFAEATDSKDNSNVISESKSIEISNEESTPSWNEKEIYTGGDRVIHEGNLYEAKWWNEKFAPDTEVENEWDTPWKIIDPNSDPISTSDDKDSEKDDENNQNEVVYPDYSSIDVGEGISWEDNVFAPFVDSTAWPIFKISEVSKETKVPYYNLGFIVSKSAEVCEPTWGTYYSVEDGPLNDEIKKIREMGGDVIISFGGAANVPLHKSAPNAEVLKEQYKKFIKGYKLTRIDFDIEGLWVRDIESLERNNTALKLLQDELEEEGYELDVWFTLPVLPTGLDNNGVKAVEMAVEAGVELDGVNVMTMDYGDGAAPNPQDQMGEYGIEAITNLKEQLEEIYDKAGIDKSNSQLWEMVGTTPMIGMNDIQSEIFDLEDARQTLEFAKDKGIGMISMWSANRDKANENGKINYVEISSSSIEQEKYEFMETFSSYNDSEIIKITEGEDNKTEDNGQQNSDSESVSSSNWSASETYVAGDKVEHKGKIYEAKWWNENFAPDTEVENEWDTPWKLAE